MSKAEDYAKLHKAMQFRDCEDEREPPVAAIDTDGRLRLQSAVLQPEAARWFLAWLKDVLT